MLIGDDPSALTGCARCRSRYTKVNHQGEQIHYCLYAFRRDAAAVRPLSGAALEIKPEWCPASAYQEAIETTLHAVLREYPEVV